MVMLAKNRLYWGNKTILGKDFFWIPDNTCIYQAIYLPQHPYFIPHHFPPDLRTLYTPGNYFFQRQTWVFILHLFILKLIYVFKQLFIN